MNENDHKKPKYTYEELSKKYIEKSNNEDNKKVNNIANDYSLITTFFVTIVLLISLGVYLGIKLDQKLNTTPLFIIIFSILGIAASFRNLIKGINSKR